MKISGIGEVRLNTKWVNYNCGVRMAGRLFVELDGKPDEKALYEPDKYAKHKPELIKEFVANLGNTEFIPPLHGDIGFKNAVFPSDGGRYVPTVILVADALYKMKANPLTSWAGLVRELQEHDEYKVKISGGELFYNAIYGLGQHVSRVWQLTMPSRSGFMVSARKFKLTADHVKKLGISADVVGVPEYNNLMSYIEAA